jgi:hypothetical protein
VARSWSGASRSASTHCPPATSRELASAYGTGGNGNLLIGYDSASQKLSLGFSFGTQRLSASTLSAGTWYVLDTRVNYGVNPHTADWQLNGVAQTQATKAVNAESASETGFGPSVTDANFTLWVDDVVVSQTSGDYPIGDGKVLGLSPDAMGTSNDPSARLSTEAGAWGATTWNKLDDAPMTSTADYVRQTAVDSSAYLETTFANTSETCINAVMGELAYHAASTNGNNSKTSLFEGATERVVYSGTMSTTTLSYRSAMIAPAAGSWTQAKVNGLTARIGYTSAMLGQPYWDALMVEYNVDL